MQKISRATRRKPGQPIPVFYLSTLLYALLASVLCIASFAPLLALFLADQGSRNIALLCPVLLLFLVLPLRFSFAQALNNRYHNGVFSLKTAFGFSLYGEKVSEGLLYTLHMIKWALPLIAAGATLYYLFLNTEVFTLISGINNFGMTATAVWYTALNFFTGIFGGSVDVVTGGIAEGLFVILGILGLCVLLLLLGIVRNSAYRYIWAEATELDKNPRYEARRALRGRRLRQLGVALINLILLLPAILLLTHLLEIKQTLDQLITQYEDALISEVALPAIVIPYGKLAIVFFTCYLPLVPIRRMLTEFFATARFRRQPKVSAKVSADGNDPAQAPLLYEDKPAAQTKRKS